jgi:uncharacterized protein (TIGR00369 family)
MQLDHPGGIPMQQPAPPSADTLAQWIAEEESVLQAWRTADGVAAPAPPDPAWTGLEQMQALMRGGLRRASIGETLSFLPIRIEAGRAVFQGRPGPHLLNPMGMVHGGWFATLLDSALGCAVHSTLPPGTAYTTTDLQVRMVRGIAPDVPRVRAEAWTVHRGRQIVTAEARLTGPDGRLHAHGSASCLVLPARPR